MASHDVSRRDIPFAAPSANGTDALAGARERATRLLTDGYAYDVIGDAEFEWRLDQLFGAESAPSVDRLVADLAGAVALSSGVAQPGVARVPREGRLLALMSETRRRGPSELPATLQLRPLAAAR